MAKLDAEEGWGGNRDDSRGGKQGQRHIASTLPGDGWHKGKSCGQWCVWLVAAPKGHCCGCVAPPTYAGWLGVASPGGGSGGREWSVAWA